MGTRVPAGAGLSTRAPGQGPCTLKDELWPQGSGSDRPLCRMQRPVPSDPHRTDKRSAKRTLRRNGLCGVPGFKSPPGSCSDVVSRSSPPCSPELGAIQTLPLEPREADPLQSSRSQETVSDPERGRTRLCRSRLSQKSIDTGTSLLVQWFRLRLSNPEVWYRFHTWLES